MSREGTYFIYDHADGLQSRYELAVAYKTKGQTTGGVPLPVCVCGDAQNYLFIAIMAAEVLDFVGVLVCRDVIVIGTKHSRGCVI